MTDPNAVANGILAVAGLLILKIAAGALVLLVLWEIMAACVNKSREKALVLRSSVYAEWIASHPGGSYRDHRKAVKWHITHD